MKKLAIVLSLMFISIGAFCQIEYGEYYLNHEDSTEYKINSSGEYSHDDYTAVYEYKYDKDNPFLFVSENNYYNNHIMIFFKQPVDIEFVNEFYYTVKKIYITYTYLDNGKVEHNNILIDNSANIILNNVLFVKIHKNFETFCRITYTKKEMPKFTEQDTLNAYENGQENIRDSISNIISKTEIFKSNSIEDYDITISNGYLTVESFDFVNKITIYDINGRVVKVENMFNVWIEDLTKGVYIAVVEFDDKSVSYKFSR